MTAAVTQLAARVHATPMCPLLLGPVLTARPRTLKHHSAARCCSRTTMADLKVVKTLQQGSTNLVRQAFQIHALAAL
jgi:hypothetical protein